MFCLQFSLIYLISLYFLGFFKEQSKNKNDFYRLEKDEVETTIVKKDLSARKRSMKPRNINVENVDEVNELLNYEETYEENFSEEERKDA